MTTIETSPETTSPTPLPGQGEMWLEVIVIPVSDFDRALAFYRDLGWRVDAEFRADETYQLSQVTPPGSRCSLIFGIGVSDAEPGSAQGLHLTVPDIEAAREDLIRRGVEVSEIFHDAGGAFHHAGTKDRVSGPDPDRRPYCSYLSFSDPDGNGWVLQEITTRLPGR